MDLRSLNTFIQVAELNNFTKAGEKLGYSQPTVSIQIKQLEQELNIQLFERIGHTVNLTDEGRKILKYAQDICRITQDMIDNSSKENMQNTVIKIAMADSLCTPLIINKFRSFRKKHPDINLNVTTAGTDELFRLLNHNEADIVCTLDKHIYSTNYVVANEENIGVNFVCSPEHSLVDARNITIDELLKYPLILTEKGMSYRRLLDEKLARNNIEIIPTLEIGSADAICKLIQTSDFISFLPDYVTEKLVKNNKLIKLTVDNFNVELWKQIIYHRDKWISRQMQAVINYLSDIQISY